jgi:glyoxylase I family protein
MLTPRPLLRDATSSGRPAPHQCARRCEQLVDRYAQSSGQFHQDRERRVAVARLEIGDRRARQRRGLGQRVLRERAGVAQTHQVTGEVVRGLQLAGVGGVAHASGIVRASLVAATDHLPICWTRRWAPRADKPIVQSRPEGERSMFRITHIDHIVLRAIDAERLLAFYRDVLGCTLERRQDELGLIQLRAGASLIDLVPVDGKLGRAGGAAPGREARNLDHFCLRIEPFDEAAICAHLRAHGIDAGEFATRFGADGDGPSVYLQDPEGNTVELKGGPR